MSVVDLKQRLACVWLSVSSTLQFSIGIAILWALVVLYITKFTKGSKKPRLPPGPPAWPVVGSLHLLGQLPHRDMKDLADKYGPLMSLRLGSVQAVVVSSPEIARQFLKDQDQAFASRPLFSGPEIFNHKAQNLAWAPYGPTWRLLRKICTVELFTAKRLKQFQNIRQEELLSTIQNILESGRGGKLVNMDEHMGSLTGNNITRMLFHRRYFGSKGIPITALGEAKEFQHIIRELFRIGGAFIVSDYIPWLKRLDLGGWRAQLKKIQVKYDAFVGNLIDEHRRNAKPLAESENFVDVLLSIQNSGVDGRPTITDVQIGQLIADMILGGTDTSSVAMVWTLTALMKYPEVRRKLREEVDSVVGTERLVDESDLPQLKYLQAVVRESFRCHPVGAFLLPHESLCDTVVAGYDIPRNTRIFVNLFAIYNDPQVWQNPQAFRPERFLNSFVDVKGAHFELIPFGSGRRMCPGINLALLFIELTVAQLIHTCDFSLPPGVSPETVDTRESYGLTTPRATPLQLLVSPRLPSLVS
ncbi:hypothetical protein AXG93_3802s1040 [Marchantia polymorpha subsp. ruderalis]|uniref:Cytochrome P450 n=2 Tax=Marchantia polymorpha TaxID=3197 RepID=A0A176VIP5_MARPO|nr:hypothetical protein AXG93_3802s1040 [Marchantia polymorpha subsp. ruderalis]